MPSETLPNTAAEGWQGLT